MLPRVSLRRSLPGGTVVSSRHSESRGERPMKTSINVVYVIDAWDDDAQESYVRVFSTADKARADLARWEAKREDHNVFAGVVKRKVL